MSKTNRIILLLCLLVSCSKPQSPSGDVTSADTTNYSERHNHYAGKLSGTWYRNLLGARATLTLEPISPERVQFTITALSGAEIGEIYGFLTVDGTKASFQTVSDDFGNCTLMFDGSFEGSIRIEQEGCIGQSGNEVLFLGLYDRSWTPDEVLALAVLEERYGVDVTRDIQFKAGSDFDIVASTLQIENSIDPGDEFSEVAEYFVKGLHGRSTSCIAVNSQTGEVWIAYVRDSKLLHSGVFDAAPLGFREWAQRMIRSYRLELVQKPDPI